MDRSSQTGRKGRGAARWAALLLAVAPLPGAREIPLPAIAQQLGTSVPLQVGRDGLSFTVDGWAAILLPLPGAMVVQLDYRARGPLLLTWFSNPPSGSPSPHLAPWHHEVLEQGQGQVTLDFRATPGWNGARIPALYFEGSGEVVLTGLRALQLPAGAQAQMDAFDEGLRWGRLHVGHTTINFLDRHYWSASRDWMVHEVLGIAFLALTGAGVLGWFALRRRWRPGPAIAVAAVAVTLGGNLLFAVRAWPALALQPRLTPGERLEANLHFSPQLGALTALAQRTLGPAERVGVQVGANDWFGWETLCYHLAPRPCVRITEGATAFSGLPGTEPLPAERLDAVVSFEAGSPLPPGFQPVASVSRGAFVARRR